MPLLSFLEQNDLSGKQVYLSARMAQAGWQTAWSKFARQRRTRRSRTTSSTVLKKKAAGSQQAVQDWVRSLGFGAVRKRRGQRAADRCACGRRYDSPVHSRQQRCGFPVCTAAADCCSGGLQRQREDLLSAIGSRHCGYAARTGRGGHAGIDIRIGDVVFFYGDYSENPSLYALGQVVSGAERIEAMSGTITIEAVA